jgi:N-acetylmuramoyl-L-alanine amidase
MNLKKKWISGALAIALLLPASTSLAYTAKPGDSLWSIALSHNLTLHQIINMNPQIEHPDKIMIGEAIHIDKKHVAKKAEKKTAKKISKADRKLLAQLVHAEAGGEPFAGKVKVAKVVLNRVSSPEFPDTIRGVIMEPKQFTPVKTGAIHNTPSDSDYQAVDEAVQTKDKHDGSLYFYNPSVVPHSWLQSKPTTEVIGHHVFKK